MMCISWGSYISYWDGDGGDDGNCGDGYDDGDDCDDGTDDWGELSGELWWCCSWRQENMKRVH